MQPCTIREVVSLITDVLESPVQVYADDYDVVLGPDVVRDSREVTPGAIFVAIKGQRVDGHDFIPKAQQMGAKAVIASRRTTTPIPHLVIADPILGLSGLAQGIIEKERNRGLKVLAITGSSGKTSTKDLLAQILESYAPTVATAGSMNNELGTPLTACKVNSETQYLVAEMGSRGVGHLRWLTNFIKPDISIILNVGTAHIGEFGSLENTRRAKAELVECLAENSWAVLNADDTNVATMHDSTRAQIACFSVNGHKIPGAKIQVSAIDQTSDSSARFSFTMVVDNFAQRSVHKIHLNVVGKHQISNALAAAAAAIAAGISPDDVALAFGKAKRRSSLRMDLKTRKDGVQILNDSYNANPNSMMAALETLECLLKSTQIEMPNAKAIAIIGDMLELGSESAKMHFDIGKKAGQVAKEVVAIGKYAESIVAGAKESGANCRVAVKENALNNLLFNSGDVVLVKASRDIGLESIAAELLSQDEVQKG